MRVSMVEVEFGQNQLTMKIMSIFNEKMLDLVGDS